MQIFSKKLRAAKKQLSRSGYSVIFSVIIGRWTIFPPPPEAARHPEQILRKHKAQYADVEVARIPRRTRLRFRIGKSANGAEGEPYHHAAPDQVGENVPEGAVERQQRKAECRRKPCPAAVETATPTFTLILISSTLQIRIYRLTSIPYLFVNTQYIRIPSFVRHLLLDETFSQSLSENIPPWAG